VGVLDHVGLSLPDRRGWATHPHRRRGPGTDRKGQEVRPSMRVAAGFDRLQSNWKVKAKRTAPGTDRRSEWTRILLFATIGMDHHSLSGSGWGPLRAGLRLGRPMKPDIDPSWDGGRSSTDPTRSRVVCVVTSHGGHPLRIRNFGSDPRLSSFSPGLVDGVPLPVSPFWWGMVYRLPRRSSILFRSILRRPETWCRGRRPVHRPSENPSALHSWGILRISSQNGLHSPLSQFHHNIWWSQP